MTPWNKILLIIVFHSSLLYTFNECQIFDTHEKSVHNKFKRQTTKCSKSQFKCDSGQCISKYSLCDGTPDCKDNSDETNRCLEFQNECPKFSYICAYGACVNSDAECNGVKDCFDNSDENPLKCTEEKSICKTNNFTCNNGKCISRFNICDGEKHCTDGSDETIALCKNITCEDYSYTCAYGGCVNGDARCNGITDCADGSDENNCHNIPVTQEPVTPISQNPGTLVTPTPTPVTPRFGEQCLLPANFNNGMYYIPVQNKILEPGTVVTINTVIKIECANGYGLYPNTSIIFCTPNGWHTSPPKCLQTCPARISESVDIKCELHKTIVDCSKPLLEGTLATMKCKQHYIQIQPTVNPTIVCKDGSWDYDIFKCFPDCGKIVPQGQLNVVGGQSTKISDFPWHVGVHRKLNIIKHICGGTLINLKVVLSAAHCFSSSDSGTKYPESDYLISAGKYYRNYNDSRDKYAQHRDVKTIILYETYFGIKGNFDGDLALIVLKEAFTVSHVVQPVCVDWYRSFEENQLVSKNEGAVVGWGFTQEGANPSDELKLLRAPYLSRLECIKVIPDSFIGFLTQDKICAGYTNGSSVCQGDSGGGLVFYEKSRKRYYIQGIVSSGPVNEDSCDSRQYGAYTKVANYISFIMQIEATNRP